MNIEILKIQAPLKGNPQAFYYNRDRSVLGFMPLDEAELLLHGRLKGYFYFEKRGEELVFAEEAPEQSW